MFVAYVFEVVRWMSFVYVTIWKQWNTYWYTDTIPLRPTTTYFLSDENEYDESYDRVPEDSVYVEEWEYRGEKKYVVRYEGDQIPTTWDTSPFTYIPLCPWIWVGDKTTEIDLTKTFSKFLVPGNRIKMDLVVKLINVTDATCLMYIDARTFNEEKFPGDGILIETDGSTI